MRSKTRKRKPTKREAFLEGLPIIDAVEPLTLRITKQDVKPIGRRQPDKCAAALAVERELHTPARVHLSRIYIKHPRQEVWVRHEIPEALRAELISFDRGGGFEVGEFHLRAIRPSHRTGMGAQGGRNKAATGRGSKRAPTRYAANVRIRAPLERT